MTAANILQWLGETSLAVSILIILVLIVRKPFAKHFGARAAYALWLAPLIRLFMPELAILPAPEMVVETVAPLVWTAEAAPALAEPAALAPSINVAAIAAAMALFVWIAVAIAWFSISLENQARFLQARRAASAGASPKLLGEAEAIAREMGMKRLPKIRVCDDDFGPAVIGLFRPVLFLPHRFEFEYTEKERRLALAHELSHITRGDMFIQLAATAFQAAQWPNPLVHYAAKAFRTDQEAACDAYVMARCKKEKDAPGDYASAILKSACNGAAPAHGLSLGHPVKERLMLLKSKQSPARVLAGAVSALALMAGGLAVTASYGYAADGDGAKQEKRVFKTKSSSNIVIEADSDEKLIVEGQRNAAKVSVKEEDGTRTVTVYDKNGKVLTENVYGPKDEMPFDTVSIKSKDGEVKTINLIGSAKRAHLVKFMGKKGEGDFEFEIDGDHDLAWVGEGDHEIEIIANGDNEFTWINDGDGPHMASCTDGEGEGGPVLLEFKDENADGDHMIHKSFVCLSDDDASADPKKRAEALRKVITRIEENAKREEEQRQKMIEKLQQEIRELEKKK